jgi:hypothetical protein
MTTRFATPADPAVQGARLSDRDGFVNQPTRPGPDQSPVSAEAMTAKARATRGAQSEQAGPGEDLSSDIGTAWAAGTTPEIDPGQARPGTAGGSTAHRDRPGGQQRGTGPRGG